MKYIVVFIISLLYVFDSFSQYVWTQKASIPEAQARYAATGFSIGNKGYVGTGYNSNNVRLSDWWEYNQSTNTWTQKASLTTARFSAASFVANGKGYVCLGGGTSGFLTDLQEFDPVGNTWTYKANFPGNGRYGSASFSVNNKGYVCGGNLGSATGPYTNDLYEYDPVTDTWTLKASFSGTNRYASRAFTLNQKGYVFNGLNGYGNNMSQYFNDMWAYDPSNDTWTQKANFPGTVRNYSSAFTFQNMGVVGTGINANMVNSDFWGYSDITNTWISIPSITGNVALWAAVGFEIGNRGYIATGNHTFGTSVSKDLWELSVTSTDITEISSSMPTITFTLFPNPASEDLTIQISGRQTDVTMLNLTDISGKTVLTSLISDAESQISVGHLPRGNYIVSITTTTGKILSSKPVILSN